MTLLISPPRLLPSCIPKFATRRRPERESFGGEIAGGGAALGQPFMPHQRGIAMTGGEIDRRAGLPAYRTVIGTGKRQTGETRLYAAWESPRGTAPRGGHPRGAA